MKNFFKAFLAIALVFALATPSFAAVDVQSAGTNLGPVDYINFSTGTTVSKDGNVATVVGSAGVAAITSGSIVGLTTFAFGGVVGAANSWQAISNGIEFEGATADTAETQLVATDPTADRTVTIPNQTGTVQLSGAATALTAGAAVTLTVAPGARLYTDTITTDNEDQTITFSGAGSAGDETTIIFVTDSGGSGDEVITFHSTLVRSTGTLTLANAAASRYVVRFMSDGTKWNEISRTAIQAA